MGAHMEGVTAAKEYLRRQIDAVRFATRADLMEFCMHLLGVMAQLAPVEFGDLRGSFVVVVNGETWMHTESGSNGGVRVVRDRTGVPDDGAVIEVYAGTAGCVYALRQHEELTWQHPRGGGPKFVEKAWEMLANELQRIGKGGVSGGPE